jgi:hypothetical protein
MTDETAKPRRRMLQADFEELLADKERQIKKAGRPTKRTQPRIKRHRSRRQAIAESQTKNVVRAQYTLESEWNVTPEFDGDPEELTREVGPSDDKNDRNYRTGKGTGALEYAPTKRSRRRPRKTGAAQASQTVKYSEMWPNQRPEVKEAREQSWADLANQYLQ